MGQNRSRFSLCDAVDWCGARNRLDWMLLEQFEPLGNRALELRVVPAHHVRGRVLDLDVGRDALVLDRPLATETVEREIRRRDAAVVDHVRHTERADQSTPGAR